MTTTMPVTTTIYTNQWVRISARLRPTNYLLAVAATALLMGAAVGVANRNMAVALEAFSIALAIGSALVILIWRRGTSTEINLGTQQVRSGKIEFDFKGITELELHPASGNLYLISGEQRVLLPLFWLARNQIKVIERMVRLLNNAALPEGRAAEVQEHLLEALKA